MPANLPHQPVMLYEAVQALNVQPDGAYLDGTFGRGGHTTAILKLLGAGGCLLALDRDPEAMMFAQTQFAHYPQLHFEQRNFAELAEVVSQHHLLGKLQGILLDIGVSSPQLDDPQRGFSFRHDGPLDMRMEPTSGRSASDWLARVKETELAQVLKTLGEERYHRRIAQAIVAARLLKPITQTRQLADIIAAAVPTYETDQHPATRTFQAIRIYVNRELEALQLALAQAVQALAPGGRLVVISFHSLEDRLVKRFMRQQAKGTELPPEVPVTVSDSDATLKVVDRIRPGSEEIRNNSRARSATMRIAERLA